jgi:hypothetical protein
MDWAQEMSVDDGYAVEFHGVGAKYPRLGWPTQLALFRRA